MVVRQLPLELVLVVMTVGLVMVRMDGGYERGTLVFAAAVLLAGLMRAVLPDAWLGHLRVRSRWLDTLMLLTVGVAILLVVLALDNEWDPDLVVRWFGGAE